VRWEVTMSKQTATDYLIQEIKNDSLVQAKSTQEWNEIFKKAKQMERDNKIEFAKKCLDKGLDLDIRTAYSKVEQYYEQTYGKTGG